MSLVAGFIYSLTKYNTTLYVGVTNSLPRRLSEHRTKQIGNVFPLYNLYKLVYYEGFGSITEAIRREKYIKGKTGKWKEDLIKTINPEWKDLAQTISSQISPPQRASS